MAHRSIDDEMAASNMRLSSCKDFNEQLSAAYIAVETFKAMLQASYICVLSGRMTAANDLKGTRKQAEILPQLGLDSEFLWMLDSVLRDILYYVEDTGHWSMNQVFHRASYLASRNVKFTRAIYITSPWILRSFCAASAAKYSCTSPYRPQRLTEIRSFLKQESPTLQLVRACSQRRTMCKADTEAGGSVDVSKAREVLPANVKPIHYDLTLEPDFDKFSYEGTVVIE